MPLSHSIATAFTADMIRETIVKLANTRNDPARNNPA
jgi:hypothetical protein